MGIDAIVSKNISAVNETIKFIQTDQQEIDISRFEDIDIDSVEITVKEDCKYIAKNYTIDDIPETLRVGAIVRGSRIIIPSINTKILIDDKLLIFLKPEFIPKAENIFK